MNGTIKKTGAKNHHGGIAAPRGKKTRGAAPVAAAILAVAVITISIMVFVNIGGIRDKIWLPDIARQAVENDRQESLNEQERLINQEKRDLATLRAELKQLEKELGEKREELDNAQQQIEELMQRLSARVASMRELVILYEKMEPSEVAKILNLYSDKEAAASIIKSMAAAKAAEVLNEMNTSSAAALLQSLYE